MTGNLQFTGTPDACKAMVRERILSADAMTNENLHENASQLVGAIGGLVDISRPAIRRRAREAQHEFHLQLECSWDVNVDGVELFTFASRPVPIPATEESATEEPAAAGRSD